ncbi:MAG: hypothetical protein ACJATO_002681, partial [Arenicella sp.]
MIGIDLGEIKMTTSKQLFMQLTLRAFFVVLVAILGATSSA